MNAIILITRTYMKFELMRVNLSIKKIHNKINRMNYSILHPTMVKCVDLIKK